MLGSKEARLLARLASNLGDVPASAMDEGLSLVLSQAGEALRVDNSQFSISVRDDAAGSPMLQGWRPVWDQRHGADAAAHNSIFNSWYDDPRNYHADPMVVALIETAGRTIAFRRCDVAPDDTWRHSPVQGLFDALDVHDRLVAAVAAPDVEIILTSYRRRGESPFSEQDRELAKLIATAAAPFFRQLARSYGIGRGLEPLTPRERSVLRYLLTGATEKQVAAELGLTERTLHQYVTIVYRKLGVTSRAQLMARFLSPGSEHASSSG